MAILKCKMCGGDIHAEDKAVLGTCDSCGTTTTLPGGNDEKLANLFNRANHFRRLKEFDKALAAYENILDEDNTSAEAHWCVVLCRYGIDYVEDPGTHERAPTCSRVHYESVLTDADYLAALEYAQDSHVRSLYEEEARKINDVQKGILAVSSQVEPFDVFICCKELTDGGSRTKESVLAQDICYQLNKDGYRVFFARITLENKLGQQYEPYIFSALNSAGVMLVVGTCREHFEAPWVRNEWSRFLALMKNDRPRLLIPCYRDMDAYDLPDELANFQALDMGKIGFMQDLIRGVKKVLDAGKAGNTKQNIVVTQAPPVAGADALLKRAFLFLEDGDFSQADQYCERVLDIDPENARAYIGKLCAELTVNKEEELSYRRKPLSNSSNYKKAMRFADPDVRAHLEELNRANQDFLREVQEQKMRWQEEKRREAERQQYMEAERKRTAAEHRRLEYQRALGDREAKTSVICGIVGLVTGIIFCYMPLCPMILGIISWTRGVKAKKLNGRNAQTGMVLGIITTALAAVIILIYLILIISILLDPSFREEFPGGYPGQAE